MFSKPSDVYYSTIQGTTTLKILLREHFELTPLKGLAAMLQDVLLTKQ